MTPYVDAHAHLNEQQFASGLDAVIARAKEAGVAAVVQNGTNRTSNEESLALARKYDIVRPALGMYPSETGCDTEDEVAFIRAHAQDICAIGEVGLDGTYPAMEKQQKLFSAMIALSRELEKPISVHTRKAEALVLEQLEKENAQKVHLHCFMGGMELVKKAIKLGYTFSIPCTIARASQFRDMVREIPTAQLLTETDAPYLPAVRGERNEPAKVAETVRTIAEIKGVTEEEMARMIYLNYTRLFG